MRLTLDTIRGTVEDNRGHLTFDRYYPMPDHTGHRFIVRQLIDKVIMVEIKKGTKVVQRGKVRHLSVTAGQSVRGGSIQQAYTLELDPDQEIYPIAEIIDRLIASGVKTWMISPMFEYELSDCVASHSSPQMVSDGRVERIEWPDEDDLMQRSQFVVEGATWAVRFFGTKISHIYLWMGAAEHADALLDTIKAIQAGKITPVYGA